MSLKRYESKRDLKKSGEPAADQPVSDDVLRFVVHKHAASHLHYDFRLELDGVLKSWAIPKGPSLDPSIKRLAMMVEDHPYEYRNFEGVIPKGNYGAGGVLIWDEGTYHAAKTTDKQEGEKLLREGLRKGDLKFILDGHKLKGEFALVRMKSEKDNTWLLIKKKDQYATTEDVTLQDYSVVSHATLEDIKQGVPPRQPDRSPAKPAKPAEPPTSAPAAPMPHHVRPMMATSVAKPFDDPGWIFEIKLDGYRCIAEVESGKVLLYSRNDVSFNERFADIARSLKGIDRDAVLDGEVVILDGKGRSSFQLLQNYQRTGEGNIVYFVFDLLYLDGRDLRRLPLIERKELLRRLLPELSDIKYSDHVEQYGEDFFQLAKSNSLEGILAKRGDSQYLAGKRSRDWLKIKTRLQQEAIICGFTAPRRSRKGFGALVLGVYENDELVHIGMAGGGFDERTLQDLCARMEPLLQPHSPLKAKVKTDMKVTWVKPVLVCEVTFAEWTDERLMRMPIYLGLREDKDPKEVVREDVETPEESPPLCKGGDRGDLPVGSGRDNLVTIGGHRLALSNLDKVFWPDEGYSKGDVIDYYQKVATHILPYLKDRPESLYRTPHGITAPGYFQKEVGELPPQWIKTREIYSKHVDKNIKFIVCQDEATLVYMANLGCIEINPWLSRLESLEFPDYCVVDLDPEDIGFDKVIEAALAVHEILEKAGAVSFPKTSGATGIHIYIPLGARYDYETSQNFAHLVATMACHLVPGFTSLVRNPQKRQRKVYLDFLQNKAGQTLAAPYSIRPRPGATVSTPLRWEEVKPGLEPGQFTIRTILTRLAELGDIYHGVLGPGIDIERCLERLESA